MKRFYRDRWNKKIGGVLGGIGQVLKLDPTILRLVYVVLTVLTGLLPMLVVYLIAWMLLPLGPKLYVKPGYPLLYRSRKTKIVGGICGGISKLTKVDVVVVRIAMVVACFLSFGTVAIAYIVGIALIPEEPL